MIILAGGATDQIELITDAAGDIETHVTWVDKATGSPPYDIDGDSDALASITTATTTVIVEGAASVERSIRKLSFYNNHASQAVTCTVQHNDGTDVAILCKVVLAAGERLLMDAAGVWTHYDANLGPYVGLGPMATQADMEAPSSVLLVVSPGRQHFHPGMAKFVCMTTGTTAPAMQTPPSYNMTSITDSGVGRLTVTIATDFSSANWCPQYTVMGISTTLTAIALVQTSYIRLSTLAAGTIEVNSRDATGTTNALADPAGHFVCGWGDQ